MNNYRFKIAVFFLVVLATFFGQYFYSKVRVRRNEQPMRIEIVTDALDQKVVERAKEAKIVYIGTSNKAVSVSEMKIDTEDKDRIIIVLTDKGEIFSDSAFFAGQRLVYNTKIKIHSIFDTTGTVIKMEYIK